MYALVVTHVCVFIDLYTPTYMYAYRSFAARNLYVCMRLCINTYMYVYKFVHSYVYVCL